MNADKKTRDWLRASVKANAPAWTSLPPEQLLALLDRIDALERPLYSRRTWTFKEFLKRRRIEGSDR